ncbi:MAG: cell division protein FtsZ [Saprospiraceae bacterium]|nr:cell division protein FtsZ [Saprospiraceae bacterium]
MIFNLIDNSKEAPIIKVIGVGGGGSNAVTHMYNQGIVGVDFAICNTDSQAMNLSPVPVKIQLGPGLTEGRGAGSKPNVGKLACEESIEEIRQYLSNNCKMLFITAGMGGGTGTGAAPIIARTAQEMDILTVGIVTTPFTFEGRRREAQADEGLAEFKRYVDTLIVVSNDRLRQVYGNLSLSQAFSQADNILTTAAKGIAEIITVPGYVNVDFEDVNTVMRESGVAIMGTASAAGADRAKQAVDEALSSPLLEDNDIRGAKHILLNITSGATEVTMDEIFEITEFVQAEAGYGTDLIWGNCYDETLGDKLCVTVIATGFDKSRKSQAAKEKINDRIVIGLDDDEQPKRSTLSRISNIQEENDKPEKTTTFEFDNVRANIEKFQRNQHGRQEPFVQKENTEELLRKKQLEEEERRKRKERQNNLALKLNNPQVINEIESEPAYLRRGINLDDVPHSEEQIHSRWTISDDEEPIIRANNSFLHDNVD